MKKFLSVLLLLASHSVFSQSLTEVLYPRYIQGVGSSNASDDRKVPFVCRMTLAGLAPSTTYRYYARFVADTTLLTNGQGYYIIANPTGDFIRVTSASLAVPGRYGEFTTGASGTYTGWYIVEPSLALEFQPGTQLFLRVMLNDGAGGGSVQTRVNAGSAVTVLGWGSASTEGTGLRALPQPAFIPKNLIFLFDNEAGTGRPVAGTFIESDGTDNNAGTNGYAPFYANNVDGQDGAWGTIIPNNLPTGVRRIAQYVLSTGVNVNSITTTNGQYPTIPSGIIQTANANTGLNELVIASAPLPVELLSFLATSNKNIAQLSWSSGTETNCAAYEVEKSSNGNTFERHQSVSPKGSFKNYTITDQIGKGTTWYRLKIVDLDGSYTYSEIRSVRYSDEISIKVFPNPAVSQITLEFPSSQEASVMAIYNLQGQLILQQVLEAGKSSETIDISWLNNGTYLLKTVIQKKQQTLFFEKK